MCIRALQYKMHSSPSDCDSVDKLQQRENEMKETEEKYKKYLEKAKTVINKMESSQNADPALSPQLDVLRVSICLSPSRVLCTALTLLYMKSYQFSRMSALLV